MTADIKKEKLAVVLFNLGGPLRQEDIRPFLFNFFMDKNIIGLPQPFRAMFAAWISWRRGQGAARELYGQLGGKSPLLENTQAQAAALEKEIHKIYRNAKVFISMRYWYPLTEETVKAVVNFDPDRIILLPLYPQYSTTTTFSAFEQWQKVAKKSRLTAPTDIICCYPEDSGFIDASVELIKAALKNAPAKIRLLFSAHGLPEKIVTAGDPYQQHCERTAEAIVKKLGIVGLDWQLCYQSRVGPLKWIGPSIDEELERAAKDGIGVLIYPLAFVSEHVETLVELDRECRDRAKQLGIPDYGRVPTVSTHPLFIEGLRRLALQDRGTIECGKVCGDQFKRCWCREIHG